MSPVAADVVVTGVGFATPLGCDPESVWASLLSGRSALRPWDDLASEGFRVPVAARLEERFPDERVRGRHLAERAARSALAHAEAVPDGPVGIYVGSTMGESAAFEAAASGEGFDIAQAGGGAFPCHLHDALGTSGPARAYGTACAAGNYAIGAGMRAVASGRVKLAITGGVEPFSRIALAGFSRLRAMAPARCQPFDAGRAGMQLGEGAAFLVLETAERAERRGRAALARVRALGLSCDAGHPTAPQPGGEGMARAMENALHLGGLRADEVAWICAHGSGTVLSDRAEARAIHRVFGDVRPAVSGLKGAFGHTLGAATAIEAAVVTLALAGGQLPPTTQTQVPDPDCDLDLVMEVRDGRAVRWALNAGYAFGGVNSALLMGAP